MRIAQIATCCGPVREDLTGSVEAIVWLLSCELTRLGHQVTVFGCRGSDVPGEFVETHPGPYGTPGTPAEWQVADWMSIAQALEHSERFDIIHSHAYLHALPLERFSRAPLVHTMHTMPYEGEAAVWDRFPSARITALSRYQWSRATTRAPFAVIPHGVDPGHFTFDPDPDDYLVYLGRFIPAKGPLEAIAAAEEAGMPLILAGPENDYFRTVIRPRIDGHRVRYAGEVGRSARDRLLRKARALLYPLREPEPFGLVLIESLMCGTPVIAPAIGAVPELLAHGLTGAIVPTAAETARGIPGALQLDRATIRRVAEARFCAAAMAAMYSDCYLRARDAHRQSLSP